MSVTRSFRFPEDLSERLDLAASRLASKPNRVVVEAVNAFLKNMNREGLAREARRQSLLIRRTEGRCKIPLSDLYDGTGWK
ncbi:MAG: hypothetical protein ACREUV_02770 [Burkholderiales bacterium]